MYFDRFAQLSIGPLKFFGLLLVDRVLMFDLLDGEVEDRRENLERSDREKLTERLRTDLLIALFVELKTSDGLQGIEIVDFLFPNQLKLRRIERTVGEIRSLTSSRLFCNL